MFLRSLIFASLASTLLTTAAQAMPPGMTMHRIQAGEPDASGWMVAASTNGGFSVRLPLKFNDFTVVESDPKAPALRTFTVGAKSQEGIKFVATRIVYREGAASARRFFSRFEKGQGLGAVPERVTPRRVGKRRAVDLAIRNGASVSYQRVVMLDSDLLLMTIEAPLGQDALVRRFVAPFFDSLVVEGR